LDISFVLYVSLSISSHGIQAAIFSLARIIALDQHDAPTIHMYHVAEAEKKFQFDFLYFIPRLRM
jgi:hypothetical protein